MRLTRQPPIVQVRLKKNTPMITNEQAPTNVQDLRTRISGHWRQQKTSGKKSARTESRIHTTPEPYTETAPERNR